MIIEPQDYRNDDILALAEAVGVVTIPNPKSRINQFTDTMYSHILKFEDWAVNHIIREVYVGRHRLQEPRRRILRRTMNAGTRSGRRVLVTLESIFQPSQDVQEALSQIRDATDRARRDISFYHSYINGMTDIGERGVQCSS